MARAHRKGRPELRGGTGEEHQDAIWWVIDREYTPLRWTSADSASSPFDNSTDGPLPRSMVGHDPRHPIPIVRRRALHLPRAVRLVSSQSPYLRYPCLRLAARSNRPVWPSLGSALDKSLRSCANHTLTTDIAGPTPCTTATRLQKSAWSPDSSAPSSHPLASSSWASRPSRACTGSSRSSCQRASDRAWSSVSPAHSLI